MKKGITIIAVLAMMMTLFTVPVNADLNLRFFAD